MPILVDPPAGIADSVRRSIAAVVIARLDAAQVPAYLLEDVQDVAADDLPTEYAEVHLSTRGRGVKRNDATSDITGWRLQVRVLATQTANTFLALDRSTHVLTGAVLQIGDRATTPLDEQPSDPPAPDDGYYSALAEWTFTL